MINLVNRVNGYMYNFVRLPKLTRVCDKLNILMNYLDYNFVPLPWFMGVFEADGIINYYPNYKNNIHYKNKLTFSIFHKHYQDHVPFKKEFRCSIYFDKKGNGKFH